MNPRAGFRAYLSNRINPVLSLKLSHGIFRHWAEKSGDKAFGIHVMIFREKFLEISNFVPAHAAAELIPKKFCRVLHVFRGLLTRFLKLFRLLFDLLLFFFNL